jgi:site-specific recombinase XerD
VSLLAPTLQAFFTERLATQRHASPQTVAAYRDGLRLLLDFVSRQTQTAPSKLDLADLDTPMIAAFLEHLERTRGNSPRTRNARLAAIHSLFRFAALRHPEHAGSIQRVLAIPQKRYDRALVSFLTSQETQALLESPDRSTWIGRRDHTLLLVAVQTGLRVAELIALRCADVQLATGPHIRCHGKSRKERCTPLTAPTVATLRAWLAERHGNPTDPLFPSRRGGPLSPDAVQSLVTNYANAATQHCPSLGPKHITPHVLRHTCAMALRQAGVDISTIALWLGHESIATSQIYFTPISPSRNARWHAPHRQQPQHLDATGHPTPYSPSSRGCDYADHATTRTTTSNHPQLQLGIIVCSA